MKRLDLGKFFAYPHKFNRTSCYCANGKRGSSPRVSIQFGEYYTRKGKLFMETTGNVHRFLAGHGIGDKEDLIRAGCVLKLN